jgi:hypothetical protein
LNVRRRERASTACVASMPGTVVGGAITGHLPLAVGPSSSSCHYDRWEFQD